MLYMIHIQAIDYLILAVYFIFVLGIGWMLRKQIQTGSDFLTSGRKIPAWIAGLAFLSLLAASPAMAIEEPDTASVTATRSCALAYFQ